MGVVSPVVAYRPSRLPVLFRTDAVVVGGSLVGIAAALKLAAAGKRVVVVEPRTYLGCELTATLRPWLELRADEALPEPLASFVASQREKQERSDTRRTANDTEKGGSPDGESSRELPFTMDSLKLHLEDQLLAAGIQLLYASLPLAVVPGTGGVEGVVIGNKSGRQLLACRGVIDASETSILSRLRGEAPSDDIASRTLIRTLEFDGLAEPLAAGRIELPAELGLLGDEVRVHLGHRGEKHRLVECRFPGELSGLKRLPNSAIEAAELELRSRDLTMAVAVHLMSKEPAFAGAYLAGSSLEAAGLWQRADLAPPAACRRGEALAERLLAEWADVVSEPKGTEPDEETTGGPERFSGGANDAPRGNAGTTGPHDSGLEIREPRTPRRGREYELGAVDGQAVTTLRSTDVLVVGGGTSGATAVTTAAREGMRTVLVEMNPGLGGTGTYGGVNDYWFGRRVGFAGRLNAEVKAFERCLKHDLPDGEVPRWNIEAKAQVLADRARRAGVEILLDSSVVGTIVEESAVRGVIVATRFGPVALLARVVIDATGDGDVAAFAGAHHVYGSEREHVTMWYSLAQFGLPGRTRNNFTSTVDVGDIEDYTRAILAGRRRKRSEGELHDHGIYVAPRETRHILGDVVLSLSDQLLRRCWPDVVNVAFSNNDVKGHTTSDWLRLGLISPNLEVEVPYRALLPRGLDDLLVVGKAVSATHDALPAIRMQADLENLGGVAALAAAQALQDGTDLRDLDVSRLQRRLEEEGVLPPGTVERELMPWQPSEEELRELIATLSAERPLYAYSDMPIGEVYRERIPIVDICCAGPRAVPLLAEDLERAEGPRRVLLAQGLAILGSRKGVPDLVSAIEARLAGSELPPRAAGIRHAVAPPDQGAMPEVVYLVHALGMTRDERALPVWERLACLLESVSPDDVRDGRKDVFDYVDAICVGAERLGSEAALPILLKLHGYRPFRDKVSREPFQADYFEERQAYLELSIGRAMARCGGRTGLLILIDYLEDSRAMLAEHAHSELTAITGLDFGKNRRRWLAWLRENTLRLPPAPCTAPTDPVASWGEEVLVPRMAARGRRS